MQFVLAVLAAMTPLSVLVLDVIESRRRETARREEGAAP
jgi:hypothetical protein